MFAGDIITNYSMLTEHNVPSAYFNYNALTFISTKNAVLHTQFNYLSNLLRFDIL